MNAQAKLIRRTIGKSTNTAKKLKAQKTTFRKCEDRWCISKSRKELSFFCTHLVAHYFFKLICSIKKKWLIFSNVCGLLNFTSVFSRDFFSAIFKRFKDLVWKRNGMKIKTFFQNLFQLICSFFWTALRKLIKFSFNFISAVSFQFFFNPVKWNEKLFFPTFNFVLVSVKANNHCDNRGKAFLLRI